LNRKLSKKTKFKREGSYRSKIQDSTGYIKVFDKSVNVRKQSLKTGNKNFKNYFNQIVVEAQKDKAQKLNNQSVLDTSLEKINVESKDL